MSSTKSLKMTDTALKFGPEWLRALSYGDSSTSPPPSPGPGAGPIQAISAPPRYKLAEFRYGREEMLALYDKSVKAPDDMVSLTGLYVEKTQFPLALMQITEEEMRMWQRGVNSDAVLKVMGRGGLGGGPSSGAAPLGSVVGGRGRGGSLERGRGRGGRGSIGGSYMRGTSYEDEGEGGLRREGTTGATYGRGGTRPFERSQSERVWPERGGEREEWNGNNSVSPRKEAVGGKGFQDNWRSRERAERDRENKEGKEEEDGWRTAGKTDKWGRGSNGWRGHENEYEARPGYKERDWDYGRDPEAGARQGGVRNWEEDREKGFGYAGRGRRFERKGWDENELPEWAAENPGESGGTFDASGAFRGETGSDDEESGKKVRSKKEEEKPGETPLTEAMVSDNNNKPNAKPRSPPAKALETISEQDQPRRPLQEDGKVSKNEDDGLDHARAVADTLIAQLVEDEPRNDIKPVKVTAEDPADKWFYRDPQGEVQGPFDSQEMADWFNSGYFTMSLMVRREVDERFTQLGELTKIWGQLPFLVGMGPARQRPPPIKETAVTEPSTGLAEADKLQLLQQQLLQQQQLFQQQVLSQQLLMRQQIMTKLAQLEGWATLNAAQQEQIVAQQMLSVPLIPPGSSDPVMQLRAQMDVHGKAQADLQMRKDPLQSLLTQLQQPGRKSEASNSHADPIAHFVQQLGNKGVAMPKPPSVKHQDPIRALLQQLQNNAAPPMPMWPGLEPNAAPGFGLSWSPHHPVVPLGVGLPHNVAFARPNAPLQQHHHQQQPAEPIPSVWDLHPQAEEQQRRLKEHEELLRREEEDKRRREQGEEELRRREAEAQAQAQAQQDQVRLLEEQRLRKEFERLQREEEQRKREETERKKREEEERKKRQLEEKRKKDEEKKRLLEEEKKRQEEIRQQLLEEERIRQEEERALEQQRRQQEALRKLQEEQAARSRASALVQAQANAAAAASASAPTPAPWTSAPAPATPALEQPNMGLAEIQKLQEEKEVKEREKERKLVQLAKQHAAMEAAKAKGSQPARWAMHQPVTSHTKSLAEIQAEEAAELNRQKEKERLEREVHQQSLNLAAAGAWGATSHLAWKGSVPSANPAAYPMWTNNANSNSNAGGFWDEPLPVPKPPKTSLATVAKGKAVPSSAPMAPVGAANTAQSTATNPNAQTVKKSRSKKEEDSVKKIFEKKMSNSDSFTQWCIDYLTQLNTSVDGPTFVGFLKDVESPYDVTDYVKSYLGESREAKDFAKQFLERRSKWRQAKAQAQRRPEDDMCLPAKAVNPTQSQVTISSEFTEVKGKVKKGKKGKMQKVDPGLLGFSITSAPDRINVGERDFVDGM